MLWSAVFFRDHHHHQSSPSYLCNIEGPSHCFSSAPHPPPPSRFVLAIQVVLQLVHFRALYTFITKGLQGKGPEWPWAHVKSSLCFTSKSWSYFKGECGSLQEITLLFGQIKWLWLWLCVVELIFKHRNHTLLWKHLRRIKAFYVCRLSCTSPIASYST